MRKEERDRMMMSMSQEQRAEFRRIIFPSSSKRWTMPLTKPMGPRPKACM